MISSRPLLPRRLKERCRRRRPISERIEERRELSPPDHTEANRPSRFWR
jgi:hypothetical protein